MTHHAIIDAYAKGPSIVRAAFAGLTPAQLNAFPVPGTWSLKQIAVHLLESDLAATHRMRRIAAEDTPPLLIAYDETAFAKGLSYEADDLALVLDHFDINRRFTAAWLRRVPEADFSRFGIHNQRGKVTLADMLQMYVQHVDNHLKFVREKRKLLGA